MRAQNVWIAAQNSQDAYLLIAQGLKFYSANFLTEIAFWKTWILKKLFKCLLFAEVHVLLFRAKKKASEKRPTAFGCAAHFTNALASGEH